MDGAQRQQGEHRLAWTSHGDQADGPPHQWWSPPLHESMMGSSLVPLPVPSLPPQNLLYSVNQVIPVDKLQFLKSFEKARCYRNMTMSPNNPAGLHDLQLSFLFLSHSYPEFFNTHKDLLFLQKNHYQPLLYLPKNIPKTLISLKIQGWMPSFNEVNPMICSWQGKKVHDSSVARHLFPHPTKPFLQVIWKVCPRKRITELPEAWNWFSN